MRPERREQRQGGAPPGVPHLSHSRIQRYLFCPEQYRLYYVEKLRPRVPPATMVFGQVLHEALAGFFRRSTDPLDAFIKAWGELRGVELAYGERDSWEKLAASGTKLLTTFVAEEARRITQVEAVEQGFSLTVTTFGVPFVGVVDLVAHLDGRRTVIDFKTAARDYDEHTVVLSDQLTAYALAKPDAEQVALCVFVKGATPRVEWHLARREGRQIAEYLEKTTIVAHAISSDHFYKRPGWWCGTCDYLPACLGDQKRIAEMLVRAAA